MDIEKKIIQSGIELFKEYGYDKTSIGMICEKAGISKGTFYYHFQSKSELIYAHVDTFLSDASDILPAILELNSPKDQLWEVYKYAFENIVAMNPELLLAYYKVDMDNELRSLSPTDNGSHLYYTNFFAKMSLSLIKKCQEMGLVRSDISAKNLAVAYNSAIIGTGLDWACKKGHYDEVERLRMIFEIIFAK